MPGIRIGFVFSILLGCSVYDPDILNSGGTGGPGGDEGGTSGAGSGGDGAGSGSDSAGSGGDSAGSGGDSAGSSGDSAGSGGESAGSGGDGAGAGGDGAGAGSGTGGSAGSTVLDGGDDSGGGSGGSDGGTGNGFTYTPSNFDPGSIDWDGAPDAALDCGTVTIDTTDPDGGGPLVATISGWCGTAPTPVAQAQPGGPETVVVPLLGLTVNSGSTLLLTGDRPVILAVDGNAVVDGVIDASASGDAPGAGGNWSCGSSQGGDGDGSWTSTQGASGGGGGGFGTAGGDGQLSDSDYDYLVPAFNDGSWYPGGAGGQQRGDPSLVPLQGGCGGGKAGGCADPGGTGGGAVQISSAGSLSVTGAIKANGGDGAVPCGANEEGGGTGGGSGGGILLEGADVNTSGATLEVNGGDGGGNGSACGAYPAHCCADQHYPYLGSTAPGSDGESGPNDFAACNAVACSGGDDICNGGGPGGGGGYGRIHTVTH